MNTRESSRLFENAKTLIPGGVNSPVRACASVGAAPVFMQSGDGPFLVSADGDRYIDYVGSWGPLILGHRHPSVLAALSSAMERGISFGAPTETESMLAALVRKTVPSMEMVRMVNSGTEAAMSAVRLARGATGRDVIIKFDGCYHGHADSLLVAAGSGVATLGIPGSPGVPRALAEMTLSLPYNGVAEFKEAMASLGARVACVILEPVAGNMGVVVPSRDFLDTLVELTAKHGALLIFDEVMTGFRVAPGGAQELFGITPDLTCLGKIIGGGLPVGAYGGRRALMEQIAPAGPVYQAGTLSGNPLAMAAGAATLREVTQPGFHARLEETGKRLGEGLAKAAKDAGKACCVNRAGSMLTLFFTPGPVRNFSEAKTSDTKLFAAFWRAMAERGVYLPPSQFEALFVSAAHGASEVDAAVEAAREALAEV
jgi:glutamate-1-semialdehyde 2,1-aminomutase